MKCNGVFDAMSIKWIYKQEKLKGPQMTFLFCLNVQVDLKMISNNLKKIEFRSFEMPTQKLKFKNRR